jgi:DHA1 family inner membrane transport protein
MAPPSTVDRGVSPSVAGFGSTLFLFGQLVIVLPIDVVSRRLSVRYAAVAGLALGSIGTAFGGVLSVPVSLVARLTLGFGMGATFLASMKYAGMRVDGGQVARAQGLLGALFTLGLAVGIAVMPWAVRTAGPVVPSVVAAAPVAVSAVLAPTLAPVPKPATLSLSAYVDGFYNPSGLALGLANAASYGFLIVASTWYTDVLGRTPALSATLVLTGFATATFVGRTWSGWLTAFVTERRAVEGGLLFLVATLGVVAWALAAASVTLLGVGLVLTGAGFGLPFGPLFSLAFANTGDDPGVLLVGMTAVGNAVALAYPWLVGWLLVATDGYVAGFGVMSVSVLGVVWLWRRTMC